MEFANTIKQLRKEQQLTQEGLAERVGVSRQAVSNWENNRNLPDIEMLICISKTFSISLDDLILGGSEQMEEKLIQDGSENKRAKMYMVSNMIGLAFCLLGLATILLKGFTVEYIDAAGVLHENFFLLLLGFGLIGVGLLTVLVGLFYYWKKTGNVFYILHKIGFLGGVLFAVLTLLIYSNGDRVSEMTLVCMVVSIVIGIISQKKMKKMFY